MSYFTLEVQGPAKDLHSGVFGGAVHEPMTDLVHLMSKLVDTSGKILVPGIMDKVQELTEDEKKRYAQVDFEVSDFQAALGSQNNISDSKEDTLMRRWRYPSLSLHGIEGAFYAPGAKTVIPAKVIGKLSLHFINLIFSFTLKIFR